MYVGSNLLMSSGGMEFKSGRVMVGAVLEVVAFVSISLFGDE